MPQKPTLLTVKEKPKTSSSKKTPPPSFPFKIGADPEFLLFHGSRGVDASKIIHAFFTEKTTFLRNSQGFLIPNRGEVGWDGASSTGELRPCPSKDPQTLTKNISKLILSMHKNLPHLDITTLSIGAPIGGHIHLELPQHHIDNINNSNLSVTQRNAYSKQMSRYKYLLSSFIMPITASDHRISSTGRLNTSYGRNDDIRFERKGSSATAELRGLSAEWLTSEKITYATIAYIGVIWNEIINNQATLIKNPSILKNSTHIRAIQQMMLADYLPIEKAVLTSLSKLIKTFSLYPQFKKEVDFILSPSKVLKEKEKHGWTLNSGWPLNKKEPKNPSKKSLLSEKTLQEKTKQLNFAPIEEAFQIPYNEDFNVALFAKTLSEKIAILNWKLKYDYFLFGLKKERKGFLAYNIATNKFFSIPTNSPIDKTLKTSLKIKEIFKNISPANLTINPKTGKLQNIKNHKVIIGIPYQERLEKKPHSLINLIWEIENNKKPNKNINLFPKPTITEKKKKPLDTREILSKSLNSENNCGLPSGNILENLSDIINNHNLTTEEDITDTTENNPPTYSFL